VDNQSVNRAHGARVIATGIILTAVALFVLTRLLNFRFAIGINN